MDVHADSQIPNVKKVIYCFRKVTITQVGDFLLYEQVVKSC